MSRIISGESRNAIWNGHGIPPIIDGGSAHTLMTVVGALCVVVVVQAFSRMYFLRRSGRIGQKVLLELRRRVFRHFQRLDIAFHDRYTSGRVVSRSTNDVEAIQDMLETGFDSLLSSPPITSPQLASVRT